MNCHTRPVVLLALMGFCFLAGAGQDQKQLIDDITNKRIKCALFELDTVVIKTARSCLVPYFRSKTNSSAVNMFLCYKYYDVAAKHARIFAEKNSFDLLIDRTETRVIFAKDSVDRSLKNKSGNYNSMAIRKLLNIGISDASSEIAEFLCSGQDTSFRRDAEEEMDQYLKK